jgi:hypothetical protein
MPVILGSRLSRLQQLQVRLDAGQRGAELVGSVGDKLPLALERLLALRAGLVERLEHAVHRPGQLADLVVGLGHRDALGGVAGAADSACEAGQRLHRAHGAVRHGETGEQRQQGPADHARAEEEPEAGDGVADAGVRTPVLNVGGQGARRGDRLARHAELADLMDPGAW